MSALMAERRELGDEVRQESLFEALAPPRAPGRPNPWAPPLDAPSEHGDDVVEAAPLADVVEAPRDEAFIEAPLHEAVIKPPRDDAVIEAPLDEAVIEAPVDEPAGLAATPETDDVVASPETEIVSQRRAPRSAGTPLAGPTLDDVMSRVWEGLVTGLPAACPVCHGEVVPSLDGPLRGRCSSCDMAID